MTIDTLLGPILDARAPLRPEDSPETIAAWDSLAHINLILAIEDAIGAELTTDEVLQLTSVKTIVEICSARGLELNGD